MLILKLLGLGWAEFPTLTFWYCTLAWQSNPSIARISTPPRSESWPVTRAHHESCQLPKFRWGYLLDALRSSSMESGSATRIASKAWSGNAQPPQVYPRGLRCGINKPGTTFPPTRLLALRKAAQRHPSEELQIPLERQYDIPLHRSRNGGV